MHFLHGGNSEPAIVRAQHLPHLCLKQTATTVVAKESETHMAYATDFSTVQHGLRDRVTAILKSISEARAQRKVYRRTLDELNAMTQRDLDDLGIAASEIPFIAREAAYGSK